MSTSRRTILQGLVALPLASAPEVASAALVLPDADLIAMARRVVTLARLENAARERECAATVRYEAAEPDPVPDYCLAEINAAWRAEMDACPAHAGDDVVQAHARRAGASVKAIRDRHAALVADYEETCQRLRRETGLERAEEVASWLLDRLATATERLTRAQAQTMAGLVAKASASATLSKTIGNLDEWIIDLAESVGRDVVRVGGIA